MNIFLLETDSLALMLLATAIPLAIRDPYFWFHRNSTELVLSPQHLLPSPFSSRPHQTAVDWATCIWERDYKTTWLIVFPYSTLSFKDLPWILELLNYIVQNIAVKNNKNIKWVYVHEGVKGENFPSIWPQISTLEWGECFKHKKAELCVIIHDNFLNVRVSYHRTYTLEIKWPIVLKRLLFRYLLKH